MHLTLSDYDPRVACGYIGAVAAIAFAIIMTRQVRQGSWFASYNTAASFTIFVFIPASWLHQTMKQSTTSAFVLAIVLSAVWMLTIPFSGYVSVTGVNLSLSFVVVGASVLMLIIWVKLRDTAPAVLERQKSENAN